ncbi:beta-galactosidase-1-like protein 3 [Ochotona princeps]|uniref:beta-galactosidase-1-like protein 3 n=1 Tax=Ochotona princeps TaxID=9978 RepID=UPI0027147492|nr:beta-galactosidase-1-like protein 3 [Ochotona princeps]
MLDFCTMGFQPLLSPCFSWNRFLAISFLQFISSSHALHSTMQRSLLAQTAQPSQARYNWSHLSPLDLKNRSVGLGTENPSTGHAHFTLDGHKFHIFGGSIHYFRVPREYWRDRLLKLKACGFNTVTTYIPWNLHEPERGKFDFSENLDLKAFVVIAEELGLWVILRPGPYICAEIDFGGLPSWLLQDPKSRVRTTDKGFVEAVDRYFDFLVATMVPLQYRHGGPVIAFQVENEYGAFNKDENYMPYIKEALLKRGIVELLLTSDLMNDVRKGQLKGALITVNQRRLCQRMFKLLHQIQGNKPILIMEFWIGWFDIWGFPHTTKNPHIIEYTASEFIQYGLSFNVYMFHGGTNFGFLSGGAYTNKMHRTVVTSYGKYFLSFYINSDAVLTEAGDYTEKYFSFRRLLGSLSETPLPPLPHPTPKSVYPAVTMLHYLPLWETLHYLNGPFRFNLPVNMENLPINNGSGQSFGFILYETTICSGGLLHVHVNDIAEVFLNDTMLASIDNEITNVDIPAFMGCQLLRILVENQGRVTFSDKMQTEQKGITENITLNRVTLKGFNIYSLEMKMDFLERLRSATWRSITGSYMGPAFYRGTLKAGRSPKDTFLSLPGWNYALVFINGRNLGRYWYIGPQKTLYLPGVWLHPEDNEIIVFEKMTNGSFIEFSEKPKL